MILITLMQLQLFVEKHNINSKEMSVVKIFASFRHDASTVNFTAVRVAIIEDDKFNSLLKK